MTTALMEIIRQSESLTVDEQLELAARLIDRARQSASIAKPQRQWLDLVGAAPYPLMGEDAQAWVSRTRQEGDDEREKQWSRSE